jgi:hypothetical protein
MPRCQSQMVLLALITAPSTVERILDHLRIPSTPPPVAPARLRDQQIHLERLHSPTRTRPEAGQSAHLAESPTLDFTQPPSGDPSLGYVHLRRKHRYVRRSQSLLRTKDT